MRVLALGEDSHRKSHIGQPNDMAVTMQTRDSISTANACVLTHLSVVRSTVGFQTVNIGLEHGATHLSFLTLRRISALTVELVIPADDTRISFASGTVRNLLDVIQAI
jgi:hypothetical protein